MKGAARWRFPRSSGITIFWSAWMCGMPCPAIRPYWTAMMSDSRLNSRIMNNGITWSIQVWIFAHAYARVMSGVCGPKKGFCDSSMRLFFDSLDLWWFPLGVDFSGSGRWVKFLSGKLRIMLVATLLKVYFHWARWSLSYPVRFFSVRFFYGDADFVVILGVFNTLGVLSGMVFPPFLKVLMFLWWLSPLVEVFGA